MRRIWWVGAEDVGGKSVAGGKMKSTTGCSAPNVYAPNLSGFSAVGGGLHAYDGAFFELDSSGAGSSTENFRWRSLNPGITL